MIKDSSQYQIVIDIKFSHSKSRDLLCKVSLYLENMTRMVIFISYCDELRKHEFPNVHWQIKWGDMSYECL